MKHLCFRCVFSGPAVAAVLLLACPLASPAQEATQLKAVLPPGIEQEFRRAQRLLAQRRPTSPIAKANIAILKDRVEFLELTSGNTLATLRQAPEPPWFAPEPGRPIDADTLLLLQFLAERQVPSPWRASISAAGRLPRDDWAGQPLREPWQLWLIASATWLSLLAIGWKSLKTTDKKRHTDEH